MGYSLTKKTERTWLIQGDRKESMYLTVGEKAALLVDSGMEPESLLKEVRTVTDLPVIHVLTHGHPDHIGQSGEFEKVYMDPADTEMYRKFSGNPELNYRPVEELLPMEDSFDLGGTVIRTVRLPGHTPGSVLFVNVDDREVFTGDAVGSGCLVLMTGMLGALTLPEYKESLMKAIDELTNLGVTDEWTFFGGHDGQEYLSKVSEYNPVKLTLIRDMAGLCDAMMDGTAYTEIIEMKGPRPGKMYYSRFGTAEMQYDDAMIK